jgi:phosphate:Na+ symporter
MAILTSLVQLFSGATLLLFSVRFMRIGIERLWNAQLRASFSTRTSTAGGLARGAALGFVMQGATVVLLMTAGLAGTGTVSVAAAAIVALGADFGSAVAVLFLQLPVSGLGPLAILCGGNLYLNSSQPRLQNWGRVTLGLGLVFLSLSIIRSTVEPIGATAFVAAVASYLSADPVAAALAGIALTLAMHSSLAAILTGMALSGHVVLGPAAALGFLFGCNIGSALLPLWLLRRDIGRARIVVSTVASLRIFAAAWLIVLLAALRAPVDAIEISAANAMLAGHLAFNTLLLGFAPIGRLISNRLESRLGKATGDVIERLPAGLEGDPGLSTPTIKRKLSQMLDTVSAMLADVTSSNPDKQRMAGLEQRLNAGLTAIRDIYSRLTEGDETSLRSAQQIVDFAIRIERCGDILAGKFLTLRLDQVNGAYQFTAEGAAEIGELIEALRQTIILAHEATWTTDPAAAERLVRHKQHVSELEEMSRHQHLARLRRGNRTSLDSSNQHLELIAALKEINSKLATIGYAVLERHGALTRSRIKSPAAAPLL